ncbi:hypothetical protein OEA41_002395 [Lepraria neglecta]|uniref:Nitrogen regulatory protein areA GATA-like domain-containing protein n=1 Tax=Lepraria neglecta TaxID=209136 RepID=A0AAD9ZBW2_9LECA|nr:hypothetical protein OEA41_002395 [Lepraria neglecta]
MPVRLEIPMLSVDAGKMRNVDTRNVENLYGMWSVFSKCADTVEDGRRLENLSWRIWGRETMCCETQPRKSTTPAINDPRPRPKKKDIPELSSSVDSVASDESDPAEEPLCSPSAPLDIKTSPPRILKPIVAASRGKEKHITSLGLEKMVVSIQDKKQIGPLSPTISEAIPSVLPSTDITPRPTSPTMQAPFLSSDSSSSTAPISSPGSEQSGTQTVGSDTSVELLTSHSVVRGFSLNNVSSSYRSRTHLAPTPIPTKTSIPSKTKDPKKEAMFLLGTGSSDENEGGSFESHMSSPAKQSSLTAGLKSSTSNNKKQLSFRDEIESRTLNNKSHEDEEVFEDSDEEEDSEDNAIEEDSEEDEDDDEEWEDDQSESGDNTTSAPLFHRVDSKPKLVSRRSLLTTLLNEPDRAAAFANMASRSTPALRRSRTSTPHGPSVGTSPKEDSSVTMLGPHMTPPKPIVMNRSNSHHQMALSPRTTRKNMLHSEMTESLRKSVLWERQQKRSTAQAVLKRSHTAHALTDLPQNSKEGYKGEHFDDWYGDGLLAYHAKGW